MWRWILLLNGLNSQIRMKVLAEIAPDLRLRNNLCYLDHLYAIINSERLIFSSQRSCRALRMLIDLCPSVCDDQKVFKILERSQRALRSENGSKLIRMNLRSEILRFWDLRSEIWDMRSVIWLGSKISLILLRKKIQIWKRRKSKKKNLVFSNLVFLTWTDLLFYAAYNKNWNKWP